MLIILQHLYQMLPAGIINRLSGPDVLPAGHTSLAAGQVGVARCRSHAASLVAAPRSPAKPGDGRHRYVRGLDGVSRLFASSQIALRNEPTIAEGLNTMDCRIHSAR